MAIQYAELDWNEDVPISTALGDVYFSTAGGREETEHVFLRLNDLESRFRAGGSIAIGELGFGTGLNFFATWNLWKRCGAGHLSYLSFEKSPVRPEDMRRVLSRFPELQTYCERYLSDEPFRTPGAHHIRFAGEKISLTLFYGDIHETLPQIRGEVDAWFLDGFAPSKNPEMWSDETFRLITAHSRAETTCSTYSVARVVRDGLSHFGWDVMRVPGVGHKREALVAKLSARPKQYRVRKPWTRLPEVLATPRRVVIVGGGLAGATLAFALHQRGIQTTLVEERTPGAGASGNPAGVLSPNLTAAWTERMKFSIGAFEVTRGMLRHFGDAIQGCESGVRESSVRERKKELLEKLPALKLPENLVRIEEKSLYYPHGGWIAPQTWIRALLDHSDCELVLGKRAAVLCYEGNEWRVSSQSGAVIASGDALVYANAYGALNFPEVAWLPLQVLRGELAIYPKHPPSLQHVISGSGYLIPLGDGSALIGATYGDGGDELVLENQNKIIAQLQEIAPWIKQTEEILPGRVSVRTATPDRMPYVGPVPVEENFLRAYEKTLRGGAHPESVEGIYHPALYTSLAHGSRGLTTCALSAELLAAQMTNDILPVEADVLGALLPARMLARQILSKDEQIADTK